MNKEHLDLLLSILVGIATIFVLGFIAGTTYYALIWSLKLASYLFGTN
jgi:hypothetical protein